MQVPRCFTLGRDKTSVFTRFCLVTVVLVAVFEGVYVLRTMMKGQIKRSCYYRQRRRKFVLTFVRKKRRAMRFLIFRAFILEVFFSVFHYEDNLLSFEFKIANCGDSIFTLNFNNARKIISVCTLYSFKTTPEMFLPTEGKYEYTIGIIVNTGNLHLIGYTGFYQIPTFHLRLS